MSSEICEPQKHSCCDGPASVKFFLPGAAQSAPAKRNSIPRNINLVLRNNNFMWQKIGKNTVK